MSTSVCIAVDSRHRLKCQNCARNRPFVERLDTQYFLYEVRGLVRVVQASPLLTGRLAELEDHGELGCAVEAALTW